MTGLSSYPIYLYLLLKMAIEMVDLPSKHGDFPSENGDLPNSR